MEPTVKHLFRLSLVALFLGAGLESAFMIGNFGPGGQEAFDQAARFLFLHGFALTALCALLYTMLPKLMGSFLYSKGMVGTHLALVLAGVTLVVVAALGAVTGAVPPSALAKTAASGGLATDFGLLFASVNLLLSFKKRVGAPEIRN